RLADPDVERAEVAGDVAPVVRLLEGGVDDLHEADGAAVELGDEIFAPRVLHCQLGLPVPVVVGVGLDDVGLFVPVTEEGDVGEGGGAEAEHAWARSGGTQSGERRSLTTRKRGEPL